MVRNYAVNIAEIRAAIEAAEREEENEKKFR